MKSIFVSLVSLAVVLFFACQGSNIIDPVQDETSSQSQTVNQSEKDAKTYYNEGILRLDGLMYDPVHRSSVKERARIIGTVTFQHELVITDPAPPAPQSYISLNMVVRADIFTKCSINENIWKVVGDAQDVIPFNPDEDAFVYLVKSFRVSNTCCSRHIVNLVLKFGVTGDTLELDSMWLKESQAYNVGDPAW